jgi:hypothetical protein
MRSGCKGFACAGVVVAAAEEAGTGKEVGKTAEATNDITLALNQPIFL